MYMFYTCASLIGNNNNSNNNNNNNNSCYGYIAPGNAGRNWPLTWRDVKTSAKRKPAIVRRLRDMIVHFVIKAPTLAHL